MADSLKLVCGLGNPGKKYEVTRHNIGYRVLECLARRRDTAFRDQQQFPATTAELRNADTKIVLLKSRTYMNNSGIAVGGAARYYRVEATDILIVHDDIDRTFGTVRFRRKGSSGGHNGLRSIFDHLHTEELQRLKIGVANAERESGEASDFVLKKFSAEEMEQMDAICNRAADAIETWIQLGIDAAMERYNESV